MSDKTSLCAGIFTSALLSIAKTFFGFHTEKHKTGGREKDKTKL